MHPARRPRHRSAAIGTLALLAAGAIVGCASADSDPTPAPPGTSAPASPSAPANPSTDADGDGGSTPTDGPGPVAWPSDDWETIDPNEAGFDPAALEAVAADAEAAGSNCLVVVRAGRLVGEWYWNGTDAESTQEVFSVTKSITATLVGIAADRGLLDLDDPASDYIEEWRGTPSEAVTIRNLVANDSGRFQDVRTDYVELAVRADDKTAFAIGLDQQHDPGTRWAYNNAAIQTLDRVLARATGLDTADFAREALFEPLGMGAEIARDRAGNTLTFMGARASCRDLARFGLMAQRGGEWDGEPVVSSGWMAAATRPSTTLNPAYGYLWWLNRPGPAGNRIAPAAPEDTYAALGFGNQVLAVFPSSEVVAVRLGVVNAAGRSGAPLGFAELASGIQGALGEPAADDAERRSDAADRATRGPTGS